MATRDGTFTIAQISDLHCGDAVLRAEPDGARDRGDQRPRAGHRRLLRRPDDVRLQGGVRAGQALPRPARLRVLRRHPGQPRLPERRLRPLRGAVRRAQLGAAGRAASPSSRSTRPSPTSTTARSAAAATPGSRSSSRDRPTCGSSSATTTCCRSPEPAASGTSSTTPATRSSASSARVSNLVLSGHKHVPYAWRLENLFIVNTGTVSSLRLRGNTRPCYNVIEVDGRRTCDVWRRYPFHGQERIIQFASRRSSTRSTPARIEGEVTSRR